MQTVDLTLFQTPIGRCGIAWSSRGVAAVQLPERSEALTRTRLLRRFPEALEAEPPPVVSDGIAKIVALLQGEAVDLSSIPLDTDGVTSFHCLVYAVARTIPFGEILTYGEVAARLDDPGAARAVGLALGKNPFPIIVPCHRVLAAGGAAGGFSANGGVATKLRILNIERARTSRSPGLFGDLPLAARP